MTIEQRLAEIIRAFHADALSSTVNLNVDLDIMLCVLAQALLAALRARLPGYATVTPDVLQRRFLETPGTDHHHRRHDHRPPRPPRLHPRPAPSRPPPDTPVPWWGNRTLRYEFSLTPCAEPVAWKSALAARVPARPRTVHAPLPRSLNRPSPLADASRSPAVTTR